MSLFLRNSPFQKKKLPGGSFFLIPDIVEFEEDPILLSPQHFLRPPLLHLQR